MGLSCRAPPQLKQTDGWREVKGEKMEPLIGNIVKENVFCVCRYHLFFQEKAGASNLAGGEKISVLILLKWTD